MSVSFTSKLKKKYVVVTTNDIKQCNGFKGTEEWVAFKHLIKSEILKRRMMKALVERKLIVMEEKKNEKKNIRKGN